MNWFDRLPARTRRLLSLALVAAVVAALLTGWRLLDHAATEQSREYATPLARQFTEDPSPWLRSPQDPSAFEAALKSGQLKEVAIDGLVVLYTLRDGQQHSSRLVSGPQGLVARMETLANEQGFALARVQIDPRAPAVKWRDGVAEFPMTLLRIFPILLMAVLIALVLRQSGMLGRENAELVEKPRTRFNDVIGANEAKAELQHVVSFLADPGRYAALGALAPRGVLLEGPPGTGKTLLARAVAGECGANFIAVDGSSFSSMYYGMGISKVKQLFALARRKAPCIIFIDEADGVGVRVTGETAGGGVAEQNRIINRILAEMDGFRPREGVVVLAATNHVQNIDPALRRPGRFDRAVTLRLPVQGERKALFEHYLREIPTSREPGAVPIDAEALAVTSQGMSPADIAGVVNRAASSAARDGEPVVSQERLFEAVEEQQLGGAASAIKDLIRPQTRERIARHEAGHALVAAALGTGRVERVTIEPRGQSLGVTFVARHTEEPLYREAELKGRLAMLLAGRQAELDHYGDTSSGAADDLKRATELAVTMAGSMGFGKTFGLLSLPAVPKEFLSPGIQARLLDEAQALLEEAREQCVQVLARHRTSLDALTVRLIEHETVSGAPLLALLAPVMPWPGEGGGADRPVAVEAPVAALGVAGAMAARIVQPTVALPPAAMSSGVPSDAGPPPPTATPSGTTESSDRA